AELLVDEQPHRILGRAVLHGPQQPFVDHALRVGDPVGLLRRRLPRDAEELLLERASVVEREDVEVALIAQRHGRLPVWSIDRTLLIRASLPIALDRLGVTVFLDALSGAEQPCHEQEDQHGGDAGRDAGAQRKAPDEALAVARRSRSQREAELMRGLTAVVMTRDRGGNRNHGSHRYARRHEREDEAAGAAHGPVSTRTGSSAGASAPPPARPAPGTPARRRPFPR